MEAMPHQNTSEQLSRGIKTPWSWGAVEAANNLSSYYGFPYVTLPIKDD